jgi:hypothetical protein
MEYRVITPSDSNYPRKIKERLGDKAPARIYYNGNLKLLNNFTMSTICTDKSYGTELWETLQLFFTLIEYTINYAGGWYSVIETEIFRLGLRKKYNTVTLLSTKGLQKESYDSFLLHRFYPPMHQFPERDEYFRRAKEGELLMLSICGTDEGRQKRKNIMERNWITCVLGDVVFIPYGPKGTKTYTIAKKVVKANIPAFTIEHPTSADLHKLGIPGFNRKTVRKFLEDKGAKLPEPEKPINLIEQYEVLSYKVPLFKKPTQAKLF